MSRVWGSASSMRLKPRRLVRAMEDAATRLGVTIRWEKGQFHGGRCTIEGKEIVVLNKRNPAETQLAILAEVLQELPLDSIYIRPAVREDINALLVKD